MLIQGGTIATWNDTSQAIEVYRNASLLVNGDKVSHIYKNWDHIPAGVYNEVVDASNKIVVPGFINTHHHVWQTLHKTLAPNLPFAAYFPRLGPLALISSTLSPDEVYQSELMGALELIGRPAIKQILGSVITMTRIQTIVVLYWSDESGSVSTGQLLLQ